MTKPNNSAIGGGLLIAVILWGANNTGTKYLIKFWPPGMVGCARFFLAGMFLVAALRWTRIFGATQPITREMNRELWWRGGLTLAAYTLVVNLALLTAPISHVAVYLGASPVWALLWEGVPEKSWKSAQRYFAAGLALAGVFILFYPVWHAHSHRIIGEILGLTSSVLWTNYGRQCRRFTSKLSGAEITAHTFWRASVVLMPLVVYEVIRETPGLKGNLIAIQIFCAIGGGVIPYALWNGALRHWKIGQVYLFNNLIPLTTLLWAHLFLDEQITPTFWMATTLIILGVVIGQTDWQKLFGRRWIPE